MTIYQLPVEQRTRAMAVFLEKTLRDMRSAHSSEVRRAPRNGSRWLTRFTYRCAARDVTAALRMARHGVFNRDERLALQKEVRG